MTSAFAFFLALTFSSLSVTVFTFEAFANQKPPVYSEGSFNRHETLESLAEKVDKRLLPADYHSSPDTIELPDSIRKRFESLYEKTMQTDLEYGAVLARDRKTGAVSIVKEVKGTHAMIPGLPLNYGAGEVIRYHTHPGDANITMSSGDLAGDVLLSPLSVLHAGRKHLYLSLRTMDVRTVPKNLYTSLDLFLMREYDAGKRLNEVNAFLPRSLGLVVYKFEHGSFRKVSSSVRELDFDFTKSQGGTSPETGLNSRERLLTKLALYRYQGKRLSLDLDDNFDQETRNMIAAFQMRYGFPVTEFLSSDQFTFLVAAHTCFTWQPGHWIGKCGSNTIEGAGYFITTWGDLVYVETSAKNGEIFGDGIVRSKHYTYRGGLKGRLFHGRGHIVYEGGSSYEGEFLDGDFNGNGTYSYGDGGSYRGEYKSGLRHGDGVLYAPDGAIARGRWSNDKFIDGVITRNGRQEIIGRGL